MIELKENQAILLQGPMDFESEMVAQFYSNFNNVLWSTWDDEDPKKIAFVNNYGINVLLNKKPKFSGSRNMNYQFYSTLMGIKWFKENNKKVNEIIKIRSDFIVYGVERLLNVLSNKEISFMFMWNSQITKHKPIYYLDYWHYGCDFPCDFVVFGNIETMYNIFNFQTEWSTDVPPESFLLRNYLLHKNLEINFDINYLKSNGLDFFMNYCESNNVHFASHKKTIQDWLSFLDYIALY